VLLIKYLINILIFIIIAKAALSFIIPMMGGRPHPALVSINNLLSRITEPMLGPIRRYTTFGMFDLSPFVVIIVLSVISSKLP